MEEELVNLTIDNQKISVKKGTTILEAAKKYFEKGMITSKVYEAMINYKIEFLNQM